MASMETIASLRALETEKDILKAGWYLTAAAGFASAGAGANVVHLYRAVTADIPLDQQKLVQRRIKEAILKSTVFCGVPRTAQALFPLFEDLKDEEVDNFGPRSDTFHLPEESAAREKRATDFFNVLWTAEGADQVRSKLQKYQPDLYLLNQKFIYEYWMADDRILSPIETELVAIAALVPMNSPTQLIWHLKGLKRFGGTQEQATHAYEMGYKIAQAVGLPISTSPNISDIWANE